MKESKNKDQKNQNILHHYICPSCGADQEFEPKDGCLSCAYCGRQEQIPESDENLTLQRLKALDSFGR